MKSEFFSPMGALKKGWKLAMSNFIVMLGLMLGYVIVSWILSLCVGSDITGVRYWACSVIQFVIVAWLSGGLLKVLLNAYDGEDLSFSVFKELLPKSLHLALLNLLVSLAMMLPLLIAGLISLSSLPAAIADFNTSDPFTTFDSLIPMFSGAWGVLWLVMLAGCIYIAVRLMFATYAFVDNPSVGVMGAFRRSLSLTQGNVWKLILLGVIVIVLNLIGLAALIVGIFVTLIVTMFMQTVAYRQIQMGEDLVVVEEYSIPGN